MNETLFFSQSESIDMLNQMKPKPMREVIKITDPTEKSDKKVKFTHELFGELGWRKTKYKPNESEKVVYLGECLEDGDMFAAYIHNTICIFKGHLNSGKY